MSEVNGPEEPLKIAAGLRGVVHAFYLTPDVLDEMRRRRPRSAPRAATSTSTTAGSRKR
ncbi:hypothetical protein [Candidatus Methanomethylophilus sp. 1R26]|uniref:hypothetical protein n=1 Tax=Candidatus Methanomethylophilus sp. 1R26 TaxID=1769296 RepID=UPI0019108276|nr:hypothetical protein [Candidatus Methanomethylophilus sp. 1R26]